MQRLIVLWLATALIFILVFVIVGYAVAQDISACGPIEKVITSITDSKWDEKELIILTNKDGTKARQIFLNPETQTWTELNINSMTGLACIIAVGEGYFVFDKKPVEEDM